MFEFTEEKKEEMKQYFVQSGKMKASDKIIDRVCINVNRYIRGQWLYLTNERMICPLEPVDDDINIPYRRIVEIKKLIIPRHIRIYYADEENSGEEYYVTIDLFKRNKWIEFLEEKREKSGISGARETEMHLRSQKYPHIVYKRGEEIYLAPGEADLPFFFDVEEELTADDQAMEAVAFMLDDVDVLVGIAKDALRKILANEKDEYYKTVAFFMEFHRDEVGPDTAAALFPVGNPSTLSFVEMVDYLKIKRFWSFIDDELEQQVFLVDLSFNPKITDELMVIYFNEEKQIVHIAHES